MKTIQEFPLERVKIVKKTLLGVLSLLASFFLAPFWLHLFFWQQLKYFLVMVDALYFIAPFLIYWYERIYYETYYYTIERDFLVIKKGAVTRRETILPYSKLQDVYSDQDILDRIFGLWDVHVSTATPMSGENAHIDGLSPMNAEKLRSKILSRIPKKRGKSE